MWLTLLAALSLGAEPEPDWEGSIHGDVKSFGTLVVPYDHLVMGSTFQIQPDGSFERTPPDPSGQGIWNFRLKGEVGWKETLKLTVHHAVNATLGGTGEQAVQGFGTGVGLSAPEVVDLSWRAKKTGDAVQLIGITDRLMLGYSTPGLDVTLGRQPVSFGQGLFFTPLDLVNPFTPTTIDSEYKPGVDSLRVDAYFGMTGKLTVVGAYAGEWAPEGMVFAAYGQGTVGVSDLGGFVGLVHGEPVVGVSAVSSLGPLGVHSDVALTVPDDEDPFVRGVVGSTWRPTGTSTLTGEVYVQTFGTTDPDEYLIVAATDRFARGEVWNWGVAYGAISWGQEITPLVSGNLALIGNLTDASLMITPGLTWSVSENATLGIGAFAGVGKRPRKGVTPLDLVDLTTFQPLNERQTAEALGIRSEFGTYPTAVFVNMRAYF